MVEVVRPRIQDGLVVEAALERADDVDQLVDAEAAQVAVGVGQHVLEIDGRVLPQKLFHDRRLRGEDVEHHLALELLASRRARQVELVVLNVVPLVGQLARVGNVGLAVRQVLDEDEDVGHEARDDAQAVDLLPDIVRGGLEAKLAVGLVLAGVVRRVDNVRDAAVGERGAVGARLDVRLDPERAAVGGHHVRLEVKRLQVDGGEGLEAVGAHGLDRALQVGVLFHRDGWL